MRARVWMALGAGLLAGGLGWWSAGAAPGPGEPTPSAVAAAPALPASSASRAPYSATGLRQRDRHLALAQERLERAQETLASYRQATVYPPESRPLREHPDQLRPFAPIQQSLPLRRPGQNPASGVHIVTTQEKVFASGAETVKLTVAAVDDNGQRLALTIPRAVAFDLPDPRQAAGRPQVAIDFNDAGLGADLLAGDGTHSALLAPSLQGFADYAGTVRVQVELNQDGRSGMVSFDVVYQPLVPAEWGGIRESVLNGSLVFDLQAQVRQAGRYVVNARVVDARGQPLALLTFNDEVGTGAQRFRLTLFGRLIRDAQPGFPLRLQDVEGFLLLPDQFPDRAMLPRRAGVVYTSQRYALDRFSDAEWQSEERSRYLTEYQSDVDRASQDLAGLGGSGP